MFAENITHALTCLVFEFASPGGTGANVNLRKTGRALAAHTLVDIGCPALAVRAAVIAVVRSIKRADANV